MQKTRLSRLMRHPKKLQGMLKSKPEQYWIRRGERMALKLFHEMAERVPAYRDFLYRNSVKRDTIRDIADFSRIPPIDKDNYLRCYPLEELCWDGKFGSEQWVISTTSGSTGEPFYFPRTDLQDDYYALSAELYLRENFQIQDKTTLYIDAFAMGAWIGGLYTYEAIKHVAEKGYALSIITPGINKTEVINSVKKLGPHFDQVIIGCYPPIMKDIIDLGMESGLNWGAYNVGIVFSAEGFSEEFRDYIIKHGQLASPYSSTLNHYGTVDMGTMSHETPLTNMVRRQAVRDDKLFRSLFGDIKKQPTLTQYVPEMFYFEEADGSLFCSSYSGLPLVRYDLKDHGGILLLEDVKQAYARQRDSSLTSETRKKGIDETVWNLPLVYLYERSDFSVTFSGAQIYPEEIRRALLDKSLHEQVTGKFTMLTGYDKKAKNYLEIHVELRSAVTETEELARNVTDLIVAQLIKENSEYRVLCGEDKSKLRPKIRLWPHQHPLYFHGKGKQPWVKKTP